MRMLMACTLLAICGVAACASLGTARVQAADEDALFAALSGWAAALDADPARIRVHPVLGPPVADPHHPVPAAIAPADSAAVRSRSLTLARLGLQMTDAVEDSRCLWARGLPPPPQPGEVPPQVSEHCRGMDRYRTVMFSRPAIAAGGAQRVRAFVLRNYGFEAYDLEVARSPAGWKVLGASRIFGVMS